MTIPPATELKIDIKNSPRLLINKDQLERKTQIEAYLFETIDYINWPQDIIFLEVHGWIFKNEIIANSDIIKFDNGSTAYQVRKKALRDPRLLAACSKEEKVTK